MTSENIYDELEPRRIDADEIHSILAALKEENNALKRRLKTKDYDDDAPVNAHGGEPVPHHLHLTDGRVISNHAGIGTHYTETLPDGTERITRVRAHYPVEEIPPTQAYA